MTDSFLDSARLLRLLKERWHSVMDPAEPDATNADVWPPPETIITLATAPDTTLAIPYRQRYFITVADERDEPLIQYDPHFKLPDPFAAASKDRPSGSCFMTGPVRWLLVQLQRFPRLLLWPDSQQRQPNGAWFWNQYELREMPRLCNLLMNKLPDPTLAGAVVLDLGNLEDCTVLCDVANLVEWSHHNFYVSDEKATEVYLLHHHDCIFMSVPEKDKRQALLSALAEWPKLIKDCSGYTTATDDEYWSEVSNDSQHQ